MKKPSKNDTDKGKSTNNYILWQLYENTHLKNDTHKDKSVVYFMVTLWKGPSKKWHSQR